MKMSDSREEDEELSWDGQSAKVHEIVSRRSDHPGTLVTYRQHQSSDIVMCTIYSIPRSHQTFSKMVMSSGTRNRFMQMTRWDAMHIIQDAEPKR